MKKYTTLLLVFMLSGCITSTRHYSVLIPETTYQLQFITSFGIPVENVSSKCISNGGKEYLSKIIAEELNEGSPISGKTGILNLHHKSHRDGGSYNYSGDRQWGQTPSAEVVCNFYIGTKVVYSSDIKALQKEKPTTVELKNI